MGAVYLPACFVMYKAGTLPDTAERQVGNRCAILRRLLYQHKRDRNYFRNS